jgi:hypothetical protein
MEGKTGFAGNRLHGAGASSGRQRKLGGSLFGGEKGQRPSAPPSGRVGGHMGLLAFYNSCFLARGIVTRRAERHAARGNA